MQTAMVPLQRERYLIMSTQTIVVDGRSVAPVLDVHAFRVVGCAHGGSWSVIADSYLLLSASERGNCAQAVNNSLTHCRLTRPPLTTTHSPLPTHPHHSIFRSLASQTVYWFYRTTDRSTSNAIASATGISQSSSVDDRSSQLMRPAATDAFGTCRQCSV